VIFSADSSKFCQFHGSIIMATTTAFVFLFNQHTFTELGYVHIDMSTVQARVTCVLIIVNMSLHVFHC